MSTEELERELAHLFLGMQDGLPMEGPRKSRWQRVARELARRDYRFRPHGRTCMCADCWYLWDVWCGLFRHGDVDRTSDLL